MTSFELILSKIREKNNRPPRQLAGLERNKKSARGQKISSPETPPFFTRSPEIKN